MGESLVKAMSIIGTFQYCLESQYFIVMLYEGLFFTSLAFAHDVSLGDTG